MASSIARIRTILSRAAGAVPKLPGRIPQSRRRANPFSPAPDSSGASGSRRTGNPSGCARSRLAPFHHGDRVAFGVVGNLVHEGADQEEAAAADLFQVLGVGWVGEGGRIVALALVAHGVSGFFEADPGVQEDA